MSIYIKNSKKSFDIQSAILILKERLSGDNRLLKLQKEILNDQFTGNDFPGYENVVAQNKDLVLNFMNQVYGNDQEMINISLKEQALLKDIQRRSMLKKSRSI